jgi:uncharacterized protein
MSNFSHIHERVLRLLDENLNPSYTYHDADHTRRIIKRTEELAREEGINGREMDLVKLAALFHDSGFLDGRDNHEERGCRIARRELKKDNLPEGEIDAVCGMIMATKIPQRPKNHLEQILADADLYYLGTRRYTEIANLLFLELKSFVPEFDRAKWYQVQVDFLKNHRYHTEFAQRHLEPVKKSNLERLMNESSDHGEDRSA